MTHPDFNQLITLDALLAEGSVAGAARRRGLSASAMSRALARLRESTGDPLLVRAGRGLVPTPRAIALRTEVGHLVHAAQAVLRPAEGIDPAQLERSFTLRTREGFVENFGAALVARVAREAPGVRLCFVDKTDKDSTSLREALVDLETGVVGAATSPELRMQSLLRDRWIGVVRPQHALARGKPTLARYLKEKHVSVARRASVRGPLEQALATLGLERDVGAVVGTFAGALALARGTDLVATVPERHSATLRDGMHSFALPLALPALAISLLWHPRLEADPAHRWLRGVVREVCASAMPKKQG